MKTIYVTDLQKGMIINEETFLLLQADKLQDKTGKDYYKLVLKDKTGFIDAKIWSEALQNISVQVLKPGVFVCISGRVEDYKGVLQVNIATLVNVSQKDLENYLESSIFPVEKMMTILDEYINRITNKKIQELILNIINSPEYSSKFRNWPAASSIHHSFRSGLLQHIVEMLRIMDSLKEFYPNLNYDILTAGIILHDIGKLEELSSGLIIQYTAKGSVIGHITLGAIIFDRFAKDILDEETYIQILHLILSHHGSYEFGSPVLPMTIEAQVLTYIDNLSSKTKAVEVYLNKASSEDGFTDNCKWMNNIKFWNGKLSKTKDDLSGALYQDSNKLEENSNVENDNKDLGLTLF